MQKMDYYLDIAAAVGRKSSCLRRKYGAILVKNDEIIATGYNGSPRGCLNCSDVHTCMRNIIGAEKGHAYNLCLSVHAEMNCMLSAKRSDMIGSTLYIAGIETDTGDYADPMPCLLCHRNIINAGIEKCYGYQGTPDVPQIVECDISKEKFNHRIYMEYLRYAEQQSDAEYQRITEQLSFFPH